MTRPDYIVEISGIQASGPAAQGGRVPQTDSAQRRRWLSVLWRCCGVYSRIYVNREETAYVGTCPGCGKPVRIGIGPDGTTCRFFEAR